eukprot:Opistho-2@93287
MGLVPRVFVRQASGVLDVVGNALAAMGSVTPTLDTAAVQPDGWAPYATCRAMGLDLVQCAAVCVPAKMTEYAIASLAFARVAPAGRESSATRRAQLERTAPDAAAAATVKTARRVTGSQGVFVGQASQVPVASVRVRTIYGVQIVYFSVIVEGPPSPAFPPTVDAVVHMAIRGAIARTSAPAIRMARDAQSATLHLKQRV